MNWNSSEPCAKAACIYKLVLHSHLLQPASWFSHLCEVEVSIKSFWFFATPFHCTFDQIKLTCMPPLPPPQSHNTISRCPWAQPKQQTALAPPSGSQWPPNLDCPTTRKVPDHMAAHTQGAIFIFDDHVLFKARWGVTQIQVWNCSVSQNFQHISLYSGTNVIYMVTWSQLRRRTSARGICSGEYTS